MVETCTFTGNRLDVACDVAAGASIPAGLAGTKYVTGGVTQAPQVDN